MSGTLLTSLKACLPAVAFAGSLLWTTSGSIAQEAPIEQEDPIQQEVPGSAPSENPSEDVSPNGPSGPAPVDDGQPGNTGELDPAAAEEAPTSLEELPEEYRLELQARIDRFRAKRDELEQAIGDQRETYIRYLNGEKNSPKDREAFFEQRNKVRAMLDDAYLAALSVLQMGFDEEAATYVATMVQHRYGHDIYDAPTLEGAARLLDGGSHLKYLFETAARSAVVCGQFEMAKNIYEAMVDENQEEVDSRLEFNLDAYREQFEAEAELRKAELAEDRLPRVLFKTTQGDFVVELFIDQAPSTVSHFIRLVEDGFYNGLDFFQVIDHLLALTGDPGGTGTGNSGQFLRDEHGRPGARKALRGSLVMAKIPMPDGSGGFIPNSASSQFAILLLPILAASEQQTIFGTVIEGMDVVSRLRRVDPHKEKKKGEIVYPPDSIIEATVIRRPEVLPEPEYVLP